MAGKFNEVDDELPRNTPDISKEDNKFLRNSLYLIFTLLTFDELTNMYTKLSLKGHFLWYFDTSGIHFPMAFLLFDIAFPSHNNFFF